MSTKSITVRLDGNTLEKIDSKCSDNTCTRTDFIKSAIESELNKKPEPAQARVTKVSYDDGKTWIEYD